jgi:hypothetical protein
LQKLQREEIPAKLQAAALIKDSTIAKLQEEATVVACADGATGNRYECMLFITN